MKPFTYRNLLSIFAGVGLTMASALDVSAEERVYDLSAFEVFAPLSFSDQPAIGLSTPATLLRYAPGVDLQARGYAELQSDLTVRGSTFEQTGMRLGAVPLYDPQTGHYSTEIPFSAEMLTAPMLATGVENALLGFNSNVATVTYGWAPIADRGSLEVGIGTDELFFGQVYLGEAFGDSGWAVDLAAGHGQGDGTVEFGDFNMHRLAARLQYQRTGFQADLAAGYLDKFYGWPNMYTGGAFGFRPETEDYQNRLFTANFRWMYGAGSHFQLGLSHREMDDDYTFDRIALPDLAFEHLTRAMGVSWDGAHIVSDSWALLHNFSYIDDNLVRSSSLTNGDTLTGNDFRKREYVKGAAILRRNWLSEEGHRLIVDLGVHGFDTTEDSGKLSPLLRVEHVRALGAGELAAFVERSGSAQVPGYTALRSSPGLFGGNPNLTTEESSVWEAGFAYSQQNWRFGLSAFDRDDNDLVDWVFALGSPNARSAQAVDVDTKGVEAELSYEGKKFDVRISYAWLQKKADYGTMAPTASYYVLNFPVHRLTGGASWQITESLEARGELEYRLAEDNVLRMSGNEAVNASVALRWLAPWSDGLEFTLLIDNLFDDDFEEFPGTPAVGRHASLRAGYRW
jgi:hypothetical protein